jgi:hypothetical protein
MSAVTVVSSVRLDNRLYMLAVSLIALVLAPLLWSWILWETVQGGVAGAGGRSLYYSLAVALLAGGLTLWSWLETLAGVLWVELGEQVRWGGLLRQQVCSWQELRHLHITCGRHNSHIPWLVIRVTGRPPLQLRVRAKQFEPIHQLALANGIALALPALN